MDNPVCVAKYGNLYLLAEKADVDAKKFNGPGQIFNSLSKDVHDITNLQQAFKFGTWSDATQADYEAALGTSNPPGVKAKISKRS